MRVVLVDLPQMLREILADALLGRADLLTVAAESSGPGWLPGSPPADLVITGDPVLLSEPHCAGISVLGITPEGRSAMLRLPGEGYRTYNDLSPRALVTEVVAAVSGPLPRRPG